MKLITATIKNYRSIEDIKIDFENNTKIFVGLSETGKSNLLKALNTLSPSVNTELKDVREDVESSELSFIDFSIRLDDEDKEKLKEIIITKSYELDTNKIFSISGKDIGLNFFLDREYNYHVDVMNSSKDYQISPINYEDMKLNESIGYIIGTEEIPTKIIDEDVLIKQKTICGICDKKIVDDDSKIIAATVEDVCSFITKIIIDYMNKQKWNVLFWKYDEKNILPSEIRTEDFVLNPDICLPLKKLFELSGIKDIKKEYDLKKSTGRTNSFENLLEKISQKSNEFLKTKWKSMSEDTQLIITESGDNIRISIKDSKNKYDMLDRSDGFKRLLTFLILISIDNSTNTLKNSLILIDCPEAEIDIPGQKYLRNELIEIGKANYVFYSTHSPYMIDNNNIYRHYVVTKSKEITHIKIGEEADYNDSSILFNALGTSLFEDVSNLNIAFEGWTDKQLYYAGLKLLKPAIKSKLEKIGICQIGGLRNAKAFAATWQLICKVKKCIILSDSDSTAEATKRDFLKEHLDEDVQWFSYIDLIESDRKIKTAEDFINSDKIKKICDEYIEDKTGVIPISLDSLKNTNISNMHIIDEWMKQFGYDSETLKSEKKKIKSKIFEKLTKNDIIDDYKQLLSKLSELIQ